VAAWSTRSDQNGQPTRQCEVVARERRIVDEFVQGNRLAPPVDREAVGVERVLENPLRDPYVKGSSRPSVTRPRIARSRRARSANAGAWSFSVGYSDRRRAATASPTRPKPTVSAVEGSGTGMMLKTLVTLA
jgi:hypothetical protein